VTENALLEALRKAQTPKSGGEGLRVEEICRATGLGESKARRLIWEGLQSGTIRRTERRIERLDGRPAVVVGYAFVPKKGTTVPKART